MAFEKFPNLIDEFRDFKKLLARKSGFNFFIAEYTDPSVKMDALDELINEGLHCVALDVSSKQMADANEFVNRLKEISPDIDALFLVGIENRETDYEIFLKGLNLKRETIAACCKTNLVLWINTVKFKDLVQIMPDLFAWHSYVFDFRVGVATPAMGINEIPIELMELPTIESKKRIRRLIGHLSETDVFDGSKKELFNELAKFNERIHAYFELGQHDPELAALQEEINAALLKNRIVAGVSFSVRESKTPYSTVPLNPVMAHDTGNFEETRDALESTLESDIQTFGQWHPKVALDQSNLAAIYYQFGEYEKARRLLDNAFDVFKKTLGENHPRTIATKKNIERIKKTP